MFSRLTPTTLRATVCASTKNKEKNACRLNPKILLLRFRDKKQFIFLVSITLLKCSVLLFVIRALHFKENIFFFVEKKWQRLLFQKQTVLSKQTGCYVLIHCRWGLDRGGERESPHTDTYLYIY